MRSELRSLGPAAERAAMEQHGFLAFIARLCLVLIFPFSCLSKIFDYPSAMAQAAQGWIALPGARDAVVGARRHPRGCRSFLHPIWLLSPAGGAAVHILRGRNGRSVSQLLGFSLQQRCLECELLAVSQEFRAGRRFSLHCRRRKNAIAAQRLFIKPALGPKNERAQIEEWRL